MVGLGRLQKDKKKSIGVSSLFYKVKNLKERIFPIFQFRVVQGALSRRNGIKKLLPSGMDVTRYVASNIGILGIFFEV